MLGTWQSVTWRVGPEFRGGGCLVGHVAWSEGLPGTPLGYERVSGFLL